MLWFAMATDGPTWYVGKREEFGQPRGWLQVKSDAASPAEIKGVWNIWFSSEKAWKECRSVKCVAVSATPGVYIVGPTPNSLLQDKLGEYRRVQLRVVKKTHFFCLSLNVALPLLPYVQNLIQNLRRVQLRVVKPKKLFLSLPKCRTPTFAICPKFKISGASSCESSPSVASTRWWGCRT